MQKYPARKILSIFFFILIVLFIYLIFNEMNADVSNANIMILFGGISFSSLFLFALIFTKKTIIKTVYKDSKKKKENKTKPIEKKTIKQSNKQISDFISDINKYSDLNKFAESLLFKFAKEFAAVQGIAYVRDKNNTRFSTIATYALYGKTDEFVEGIGLNGQTAINKKIKIITEIPEGYITVISGLGSSYPKNLLIIPFVYNNKTIALIEIAAFEKFPENINDIYIKINNKISETFNALNS